MSGLACHVDEDVVSRSRRHTVLAYTVPHGDLLIRLIEDLDRQSRLQPSLGDLAEHGSRLVFEVHDVGGHAHRPLMQRLAVARCQRPGRGRNRIAMRIVTGVPELDIQRVGLGWRHRVLVAIGGGM